MNWEKRVLVQSNSHACIRILIPLHCVRLKPPGDDASILIPLVDGLTEGEHVVSVTKVSQNDAFGYEHGSDTFGGFELSSPDDECPAARFGPAPKRRLRKIEIIGDSDASGYCKEGKPGEQVIKSSAWIPHKSNSWSA